MKDNAVKVLANCRAALSYSRRYLDANGNLPSGKNHQDFYEFILDKMFQKLVLKDKITKMKITNAKERKEIIEMKRPSNWMFPGWMSFVLFGPLADESVWSELMRTGK
jgi:hypothetical protein